MMPRDLDSRMKQGMMLSSRNMGSLFAMVALFASPGTSFAQSCDDDSEYAVLDFWVGEWDVMVGGERVGTNRIEKILSGCALLEHWVGAGGGEGKSLIYRVPSEDAWKQVWVTQNPSRPGGVKEKTLIERTDDGGTIFRGEVVTSNGSVLDQTRLIPLEDGTVRQLIEYSQDDGDTWQPLFDAIYVRSEAAEVE